ncbi:MAG: winged helix-turn-helix domain-containing protein [Chloroflexi bacterium]|nr:winged helix-turn-helix domain-containing protein [Chloroflexota bacterium]
MAFLAMNLLGTFKATLDGELITRFATDKERALLAYLAVEREQPHRRDSLMALLWPNQSKESAANNLRKSLFRLRQSLQDRAEDFFLATPAKSNSIL